MLVFLVFEVFQRGHEDLAGLIDGGAGVVFGGFGQISAISRSSLAYLSQRDTSPDSSGSLINDPSLLQGRTKHRSDEVPPAS